MAPILLGYWDVRGLGTPIRLMLEQANADYEEKLYKCGGPPDFNRTEWLDDKFNLGLDFPNLPYLVDGDVKLTQSHVILRYLARKFNMNGSTEAEQLRADLLATQTMDFHMEYCRIVYNPDFLKLKEAYQQGVPDKLKLLTKFIGSNKYAVGNSVTYADFVLFEYLEGQLYFNPELLKDSPELQQFHKNMLALESVDRYFKSPKAIKFPFNGAPALFGGAYSDQLIKQ